MTINDDIAEAYAYADKGPALSRATAGRLADEIEALRQITREQLTNAVAPLISEADSQRPTFVAGVAAAVDAIADALLT